MYDLLKGSVEQSVGTPFSYKGGRFTVTIHEFAPVTLRVYGQDRFLEIDLVPAFELDPR